MGRRLIIISFIFSLGLAVYLYINRDEGSLRENIRTRLIRDPRVVLDEFVMRRYQKTTLKAEIKARQGNLYDPNIVELNGDIEGFRVVRDGERETMGAELATAQFASESILELMDEAPVASVVMRGFVEFGLKDHFLTTDYAEYLNKAAVIMSDRPVRVEGPNRVFHGEEGFTYKMKDQTIQMPGQVRGVVRQAEGIVQ